MILQRIAARNHLKIKDSAGGLVDHVTRGFAGPFDNGFGVTGLLGQAVGEGRADVERHHLGAETKNPVHPLYRLVDLISAFM